MAREKPQNSIKTPSKTEINQTSQRTQIGAKRDVPARNSEIEDEIQSKRREIYVESITRGFLRNLLQNGKKGEIIPQYHPASGFIYEQKLKQKGEKPKKYTREFLENLVSLDILHKSFYYSISTCPNCESPSITLHPSCLKCKNQYIEKINLTEHIPCGYIDQKSKYTQDICPKCGNILVEGEYRDMGRWYVCKVCGERLEHPQFNLVCRECNTSFTIEEAKIMEVPKFTLNPNRTQEIRQNVASLENISKLLIDLGFKIEMPGSVTGHKSGMKYCFSILAKKQTEGKEIVIAVDQEVAENEIQAQPLILYVYKISEMKVDLPIFIALPKLSQTAAKIAKAHNILTIEGSPEGERLSQIKTEIENRINYVNTLQTEYAKVNESITKEVSESSIIPSANSGTEQKRKRLRGVFSKWKLKNNVNYPSTPEVTSEETELRNIIILLDSSNSMRNGNGDLSNFSFAKKAIENLLTNPDPMAKNDLLTITLFWDGILRGFQKEILYENVSMGNYINPLKINQLNPKKNAGTPVWKAVEFAIRYLQGKKGYKIVKLLTDAVSIPPLKKSTITKLENSSTRLDCIVVGSEGIGALGKRVNDCKLVRFFESVNQQSLVLALKA